MLVRSIVCSGGSFAASDSSRVRLMTLVLRVLLWREVKPCLPK